MEPRASWGEVDLDILRVLTLDTELVYGCQSWAVRFYKHAILNPLTYIIESDMSVICTAHVRLYSNLAKSKKKARTSTPT